MGFPNDREIGEGRMSLLSTLQTGVSGMSAQSNLLSTIGDNIANASTVGYKDASAQFESLLGLTTGNTYNSGSVQTTIRYGITDQGTQLSTTTPTDMEIQGNGFFVVQNAAGATAMTREGDFIPNSSGSLVNSAGYSLMGYPIDSTTGAVGTTLQLVNTSSSGLQATASTSGTLSVNLPSNAAVVASNDPSSTNTSGTVYSAKTSVTTYDDLGNAVVADIYMAKTGTNAGPPPTSTWTITAYNAADATNGGFPYSSTNLGTGTYIYNDTTGKLDSTNTGGTGLSLNIPNGNTISLDMTNATQLASPFVATSVTANGNAPGKLSSISIGTDGTLTSVYSNGATQASYQIPLATVVSPDNLTPINGNAYQPSTTSGNMTIGTASTGGYGSIQSSSLEASTVDIATQLTDMIAAQRAYEANSKVLQTSSDLLSLINKLQS